MTITNAELDAWLALCTDAFVGMVRPHDQRAALEHFANVARTAIPRLVAETRQLRAEAYGLHERVVAGHITEIPAVSGTG